MATPTPHATPQLLTVAETAELFRVTPQTIRRWIDAGALVAIRPGRVYRVTAESANALLERASA